VTVSCPLDCPYLQEARKHDREVPVDPDQFPNKDIRVTDEFIRDNEELITATAQGVLAASLETAGAVDSDVREALDALVRTYRTLEGGVYYESRPANLLANQIYSRVRDSIEEFRRSEQQQLGMTRTRDSQVLAALAFLQRLGLDRNNGRPRGRAFIDFLRSFFPATAAAPAGLGSSLIVP